MFKFIYMLKPFEVYIKCLIVSITIFFVFLTIVTIKNSFTSEYAVFDEDKFLVLNKKTGAVFISTP